MRRWLVSLATLALACAHPAPPPAAQPEPTWVLWNADDHGQREAWRIEPDGRVFHLGMLGGQRPAPAADAEPMIVVGAESVSGDGTIVRQPLPHLTSPGDMSCRIVPPCRLECACASAGERIVYDPSQPAAGLPTIEPVPRGARCQPALVVVARLLMEVDQRSHSDIF